MRQSTTPNKSKLTKSGKVRIDADAQGKGKIKIKYDYNITFHILLYGQNNRIISKDEVIVGEKHSSYEVADQMILDNQYHKVCNIKRIVVYWEKN